MTVTLDIPPEREAALRQAAASRGLSLEEWLVGLAEQAATRPHEPGTTAAEARQGRFREFVERFSVPGLNLPPEAVSRESIYHDDGTDRIPR